MAQMTWFKLYDEFADDPKMLSLDDGMVVIWLRLMCLANRNEAERGVIARAPRAGLAKQLYTTPEQLNAALELFASDEYRMLTVRDDGAIALTNWNKRNARKPSDAPAAVADRKRRHAERAKNAAGTRSERVANADGASENAPRYRYRDRDKSTPLTPLGGSDVLPDNRAEDFVRFWNAYPNKREKSAAFAAWENALVDGAAPDDMIAAAEGYAAANKGQVAKFLKFPANFLASDSWQEYMGATGAVGEDKPARSQPAAADERGRYIPGVEETRRRMAEEEAFLRGAAHV